jgi:hypothetical protein
MAARSRPPPALLCHALRPILNRDGMLSRTHFEDRVSVALDARRDGDRRRPAAHDLDSHVPSVVGTEARSCVTTPRRTQPARVVHLPTGVASRSVSKREQEGLRDRRITEGWSKGPQVRGVREGGFEPPRPFGHRILRLLRPGTDPGSTCRPVSSGVVLCHPVSFRREQAVSENGAVACSHVYVERCPPIARTWRRRHEKRRSATAQVVIDGLWPGLGPFRRAWHDAGPLVRLLRCACSR